MHVTFCTFAYSHFYSEQTNAHSNIKTNLGKKENHSSYISMSHFTIKRTSSIIPDTEAVTRAETTEEHCSLICSQTHVQLPFLYSPGSFAFLMVLMTDTFTILTEMQYNFNYMCCHNSTGSELTALVYVISPNVTGGRRCRSTLDTYGSASASTKSPQISCT